MAYNFLIIGEKCDDVFHYGSCVRMSPEAPVPIFTTEYDVLVDGMAKNVYNNLEAICKTYNLSDCRVHHVFSHHSAVKERFVDKKTNHYFLRLDSFDDKYSQIELDAEIEYCISKADCIIISDYNKGFLSVDDIKMISNLRKENCILFIDTKKKITKDIISCVDFIKINEKELKNNLDIFLYNSNIDKFIITLGEKGAMYKLNKTFIEAPQSTIDVSGAGDTFMAALAFKYMQTKNIEESIVFANQIASIVVSKKGVSTI
jgi:D-beta-D-heptose 7-phosphate kinase/D-beta-D-heptose 1-phosphate adenosyltransferase